MKGRVSAYDVAKLAKVSQSTVSRVLNNYPHVRKETRQRVHDAINTLGFSPDEIARSLASKKTNTIGLIVEDISNSFYAETAHIILREAQKYDYEVIIIDAETDENSFERAISTLNGKRVDGIIVASTRMDNQKVKEFYDKGFPIIFYNRRIYGIEESHYVEVDNKLGAKMAVNHLVENKHRKIAFISGPTIYSTFYQRFEGYKEAVQDNGLEYDESLIYKGEVSYDQVFQFALNLMRDEDRPTAFFASTDQMALAIMDAAARSGRHIPFDVSVIGFDDIEIASNPYISLSTISQRKREMAVLTLQKLLSLINSDDSNDEPNKITLEPELIIRKTTGVNNQ
ncbi:LacI family DNA-binding transcriptional regulator [Oceanobacillus sp. CFH 90083]|uniref:LacI family DNA-binding transcriptional regulator n=1 Tax=Oceanobacillus sp. CFH 90083 TaxID=2592336 RepID=UPI00128CBDF8|nr:LacI family DNA-binding transcriptional regulator [Oceanobacillus sp. CFH 90083]